jgi:Fic/DOC family N-terminal
MRTTGKTIRRTVAGEAIASFVPYPLPPRDTPLSVGGELAAMLARAEHALARLEVAGEMVPSLDWFIYAFVRKEAVISSQIEGTQATLLDLLEFEAEQTTRVAVEDVHEVCNYLDAIKYARSQIKGSRGLPREELYSHRHASINDRAWARLVNQFSFKHSSRNRPLNDSAYAF